MVAASYASVHPLPAAAHGAAAALLRGALLVVHASATVAVASAARRLLPALHHVDRPVSVVTPLSRQDLGPLTCDDAPGSGWVPLRLDDMERSRAVVLLNLASFRGAPADGLEPWGMDRRRCASLRPGMLPPGDTQAPDDSGGTSTDGSPSSDVTLGCFAGNGGLGVCLGMFGVLACWGWGWSTGGLELECSRPGPPPGRGQRRAR